ncbi:HD-GYP domain-containing protein [Simiduia aestuariiviva]|uniref:HD-GYP domain-containing protein (C-di-GMP phosphodiesterase class II) n=1 Tax=Simiduia aestuariiviva TaxID=1510459 RepID=A0A839UI95_9GAMM|nr:HD-GYP domain-containing protein [Simiduia aestuariiviva]MBB3167233.1 HD-GYP domain-containing protein (c-di-GMP phosphodiesterase class II) [Simiduia aestuariiviva]
MAIKQLKVDVNELTPGMFVSGLDRPWSQTPFPLQGFYIRELDEIKELKAHCRHVYIDVAKGKGPVASKLKTLKPGGAPASARGAKTASANIPVAPLKIKRNVYQKKALLKKEVTVAKELHQQVHTAMGQVLGQLEKGRAISVKDTKRAASEMVDSVIRNPDAFSWLARVREIDEHTYTHAMRSSVWGILFGRHIGLGKADLDTLALGILFKDLGKVKIDKQLIAKKQRTPAEEIEYEKFVLHGCDILRQMPGIEPRVIAVVKTHCERLNGSGFPQHLRGDKIPMLGKIAGIVTFYDDTTNPRGEAYPLAPSKAVAKLYELRDVQFQEELVVEFIRAIGLYPTGTLVELSTGEVGVVVEQNFERRLKPKVMLVLDACKHQLRKPILLDLAEDDRQKQALIDSGKKRLSEVEKIEIAQDLEPGSYDIDIATIRDEYLFKPEKKGWLSGLFGK